VEWNFSFNNPWDRFAIRIAVPTIGKVAAFGIVRFANPRFLPNPVCVSV
jgi:hypothetical protein